MEKRYRALKVNQWLPQWDEVEFDDSLHRKEPQPHFYLLTMPAADLLRLSGIYRRQATTAEPRRNDTGIQRWHDKERTKEISEYVEHGYPWSDLSPVKRRTGDYSDLKKPGWLPTAIVVNVLLEGEHREGRTLTRSDAVTFSGGDDKGWQFVAPPSYGNGEWLPESIPPLEVIDGQHRLWAFDGHPHAADYDLPVVAFHGLDISWQAYLFWTINIRPKRINASLAFDLYPLLRLEDWLEKFEGHPVYRESRSQELVEALWSHHASPWYQRINMLGEPGQNAVRQSAWIRSLMSTFVKSWSGRRVSIGGLFGAAMGEDQSVLPWTRNQQAAFLIVLWQLVNESVAASKSEWARALREPSEWTPKSGTDDPAFYGEHALLNTDQGVRGVLYAANDLTYLMAKELSLFAWDPEGIQSKKVGELEGLISSLRTHPVHEFLKELADLLADFDWRTSAAPGLSETERLTKASLRGSGGYKELRRQLLLFLKTFEGRVGQAAGQAFEDLGYEIAVEQAPPSSP